MRIAKPQVHSKDSETKIAPLVAYSAHYATKTAQQRLRMETLFGVHAQVSLVFEGSENSFWMTLGVLLGSSWGSLGGLGGFLGA